MVDINRVQKNLDILEKQIVKNPYDDRDSGVEHFHQPIIGDGGNTHVHPAADIGHRHGPNWKPFTGKTKRELAQGIGTNVEGQNITKQLNYLITKSELDMFEKHFTSDMLTKPVTEPAKAIVKPAITVGKKVGEAAGKLGRAVGGWAKGAGTWTTPPIKTGVPSEVAKVPKSSGGGKIIVSPRDTFIPLKMKRSSSASTPKEIPLKGPTPPTTPLKTEGASPASTPKEIPPKGPTSSTIPSITTGGGEETAKLLKPAREKLV